MRDHKPANLSQEPDHGEEHHPQAGMYVTWVVVAGALLTVGGVLFIWQQYEYFRMGRQVATLRKEAAKLRQDIDPLEVELDYLSRPERLNAEATGRLGLGTPDPRQIYQLEVHGAPSPKP